MGFQLVPKLVTLNGIITVILRNSTEFGSFEANYVKAVSYTHLTLPTIYSV